jgi:peptide/nickel transport system ATP-binding protein
MSSGAAAEVTGMPAAAAPGGSPVLSVSGLTTRFRTQTGDVTAVNGVSFDVYPGETLAIVGESGSGKSVTVMSLLDLVAKPAGRVVGGTALFEGRDLLQMPASELRKVRGSGIAMVFQDPMSALNPVMSIGAQITEALKLHDRKLSARQARERTVELLAEVGLPAPEASFRQYPHEYSGGMRQRALIAMAMANNPKVLIADEPTTALDVTIQAQILRLLRRLGRLTNAATILITHDLGLVAELADRVMVMYGGRAVECADVQTLFRQPRHPYTIGLLSSRPRLDMDVRELRAIRGQPPNLAAMPAGCAFQPRCDRSGGRALCTEQVPALRPAGGSHTAACHFPDEAAGSAAGPLEVPVSAAVAATAEAEAAPAVTEAPAEVLRVDGLSKQFTISSSVLRRGARQVVNAVNGVSFAVHRGETLGIVGETGCGKSTTGRMIMRILDPTSGRVILKGRDITDLPLSAMPDVRRSVQIVFQDPYGSLDPRMKVADIIAEPLRINHIGDRHAQQSRVTELLELVGLGPEHADRYPHQFSGGQRQRIGIARALAMEPELLVLDEPVSALDVSLQAQVVNLLNALKARLGISYVFISHDLSMVRYLCDTVAVMYAGEVMESGPADEIFARPSHPYTQALLSSVPIPDPALRGKRQQIILEGDAQGNQGGHGGCVFAERCFKVTDKCRAERPALAAVAGASHLSACHYRGELNVIATADELGGAAQTPAG